MKAHTANPHTRTSRTSLRIAAGLLAASTLGMLPIGSSTQAGTLGLQIAEAQNFGQRIIQGKVFDDTGTAVGGATIFLKNVKTRNVKSFTSTPDGSFRFAQVGMVDDYDVWAELGKKKTAVKTISSFDARKQVEFELKFK